MKASDFRALRWLLFTCFPCFITWKERKAGIEREREEGCKEICTQEDDTTWRKAKLQLQLMYLVQARERSKWKENQNK